MIVVADTGPINYLVLIGEIEVLPALYGRVFVPLSVWEELTRPQAPKPVREWVNRTPDWFEPRASATFPDAALMRLDAGERDAILLAEELKADQLIVDEIRGRAEARRRRIPFTGTLGVLAAGAEAGLLDLRGAIDRLRQTNFHVSANILDRLVEGQP